MNFPTGCEGDVHVSVGCLLLIRPIMVSGNGLIALTCPIDADGCTVLLPVDFRTLGLDGCVLVLWYLDEPTALLWVAPYPGEASAASTKTRWQSRTRRVSRR